MYGKGMFNTCVQKQIQRIHTRTWVVAVVDGRPQGVGRQPVSQNEAQSNRSEMKALEDSQTATSNTQAHTQRVRGKKYRMQTVVIHVVCKLLPSRKKKKKKNLRRDSFTF